MTGLSTAIGSVTVTVAATQVEASVGVVVGSVVEQPPAGFLLYNKPLKQNH